MTNTVTASDLEIKVSCIDRVTGSESYVTTLGELTINWKLEDEEIEKLLTGHPVHRYSTNMRRHSQAVKL